MDACYIEEMQQASMLVVDINRKQEHLIRNNCKRGRLQHDWAILTFTQAWTLASWRFSKNQIKTLES